MCNINPSKHAWYKIKINHFSQKIKINTFYAFLFRKKFWRTIQKKILLNHSSHLIRSNISKLRAIKVLCIYVESIFCKDCRLKMLAVDHLTLRDILYHQFRKNMLLQDFIKCDSSWNILVLPFKSQEDIFSEIIIFYYIFYNIAAINK